MHSFQPHGSRRIPVHFLKNRGKDPRSRYGFALRGASKDLERCSDFTILAIRTAFICLALWMGCAPASDLKTYPVKGTVRLKGQPVVGATVMLHTKSEQGIEVINQAETDEEGGFRFQTVIGPGKFQDGIVAGEYQISLSKMDVSQLKEMTSPPKDLFPPKYTDPTTSGLTAKVTPDGDNTFTFEIP